MYKDDINTKMIEIRSFLLYLSQNFQAKTLTTYGNFIAAKTNAICESERLFSAATIGINKKLV
jgi:hypothetical protein